MWLILALACSAPAAPVSPAAPQAPPAPAPPAAAAPAAPTPGAIVRDGGRPEATLPMVVALHGRGDSPANFVQALEGLDEARVVALEAPLPYGDGYSWFAASSREMPEAEFARALGAQAEVVAARITQMIQVHPTKGRPVVTGFSQGGMLSWAIALTHPELVAGAVALGGFAPPSLIPAKAPAGAVPIRALHGTADPMVAFAKDDAAVQAARAAGFDATLTPFEGVPHAITAEVHREWMAQLRAMFSP